MGNTNTIHISAFEYSIDDILTLKFINMLEPSISWIPFMVGQKKEYKEIVSQTILKRSLDNIPQIELNSDNSYTKDNTYITFKNMLSETMKHTKHDIGYSMQLIMSESCFPILECLSEIIQEELITLKSIDLIVACDNITDTYFDIISNTCRKFNIDITIRLCNLHNKKILCKVNNTEVNVENKFNIEKKICNANELINTKNCNTKKLNEYVNQLLQLSVYTPFYIRNVKMIANKIKVLTKIPVFDDILDSANNSNKCEMKSMLIPFILDNRLPKRRVSLGNLFVTEYYIDDEIYYTNKLNVIIDDLINGIYINEFN